MAVDVPLICFVLAQEAERSARCNIVLADKKFFIYYCKLEICRDSYFARSQEREVTLLKDGERIEKLSNDVSVIISKEHTFGTDTMLLADFSLPKKHEFAVEIGTGCGTIPLYWCSTTEVRKVFAIDIQEKACSQLKRSIEMSHVEDKIEVLHADIKSPIPSITTHSCDLVVCNPPYKAVGCGIVNPDKEKRIARHEHECTIDDVTSCSRKLLNFWGRLCLCHRVERLCDVIESMRKNGIEPKKIRFVQQRKSSPAKLFLIEGKKGAKPGLISLPTLFIENDQGDLSDEMKRIYKYYGERL